MHGTYLHLVDLYGKCRSGFPENNPMDNGMGCFDHQSYSREGSGVLGYGKLLLKK